MGSTLSIAPQSGGSSPRPRSNQVTVLLTPPLLHSATPCHSLPPGQVPPEVQQREAEAVREQELRPLEEQPWWAGDVDLRTATERIKSLPTGQA